MSPDSRKMAHIISVNRTAAGIVAASKQVPSNDLEAYVRLALERLYLEGVTDAAIDVIDDVRARMLENMGEAVDKAAGGPLTYDKTNAVRRILDGTARRFTHPDGFILESSGIEGSFALIDTREEGTESPLFDNVPAEGWRFQE